ILGTLLAANDRYDLGLHVTGMVRNVKKAEQRLGTALQRSDFTLMEGDVIEHHTFERGFSTVFHGASPARPSLHKSSPGTTLKANTLGTINLLDALVDAGGTSFVLLSSSEVYGSVKGTDLIGEDAEGTLQHCVPRARYSSTREARPAFCVRLRRSTDLSKVRISWVKTLRGHCSTSFQGPATPRANGSLRPRWPPMPTSSVSMHSVFASAMSMAPECLWTTVECRLTSSQMSFGAGTST